MKFSHSLQFNAVPEWSSKYISYTSLKKLIYSLQRESLRRKSQGDGDIDLEGSHLISNDYSSTGDLNGSVESPSNVFIAALNSELKKIDNFYQQQESFIFQSIDELMADIESFEKEIDESLVFNDGKYKKKHNLEDDNLLTDPDTEFTQPDDEDDDEEDDEETPYRGRQVRRSESSPIIKKKSNDIAPTLSKTRSIDDYLKSIKSPQVWDQLNRTDNMPPQLVLLSENRIILRKRIIGLFTTLSELKSFIELNQTGFKKACKKFDKSLNTSIKDDYLKNLPNNSYVFKPTTIQKVDERLEALIKLYALICNHGDDFETAKQELSIHLREHVVWERNTVWRDMIGLERKTYAANSKLVDRTTTKEKEDKN